MCSLAGGACRWLGQTHAVLDTDRQDFNREKKKPPKSKSLFNRCAFLGKKINGLYLCSVIIHVPTPSLWLALPDMAFVWEGLNTVQLAFASQLFR